MEFTKHTTPSLGPKVRRSGSEPVRSSHSTAMAQSPMLKAVLRDPSRCSNARLLTCLQHPAAKPLICDGPRQLDHVAALVLVIGPEGQALAGDTAGKLPALAPRVERGGEAVPVFPRVRATFRAEGGGCPLLGAACGGAAIEADELRA